ncbi:glycerate kinase [Microbacterium rhizomatis]|uniref:Glycerate kinase n=1 Tax=Microbacterium rhizomatis TaxID=1631477 RepID=A0A5J5IZ68_9MICO|nr:glycerate kinase [Microbacterium rhizomatis]
MTVGRGQRSISVETVILIAPNKFSGSMTAPEAADAITGIHRVLPANRLPIATVADGGEGTVDEFMHARGERRLAQVRGPLGTERLSPRTVYVGAAHWSRRRRRSACDWSILRHAESPSTDVTVALGGTATSDGGIGMTAALGIELIGRDGSLFDDTQSDLLEVARIRATEATAPRDVEVIEARACARRHARVPSLYWTCSESTDCRGRPIRSSPAKGRRTRRPSRAWPPQRWRDARTSGDCPSSRSAESPNRRQGGRWPLPHDPPTACPDARRRGLVPRCDDPRPARQGAHRRDIAAGRATASLVP